jgi:molybdopterin converting factor subunit 1
MKIKILYFAEARKIAKKKEEYVNFPGKTILDLKNFILDEYPKLKEIINESVFALNLEYANEMAGLKEGDVVAIIPPVEGG